MEKITDPKTATVEVEIEELEAKIAPDGGETVLPIGAGGPPRHH